MRMNSSRSQPNAPSTKRLRFELLESRQLLSVSSLIGPLSTSGFGTTTRELGPVDFQTWDFEETASNQLFGVKAVHDGLFSAELRSPNWNSEAHLRLYSRSALFQSGNQRMDWQVTAGERYVLEVAGATSEDTLVMANLVERINDRIHVYGTSQNDQFVVSVGQDTQLMINGLDYSFRNITAIDFDGGAGANRAEIMGSNADERLTTFQTTAILKGGTTRVEVVGAHQITVHGGGGNDQAHLGDSAGDDTFLGTPTYSEMSGNGFFNRVEDFDAVHAYGRLGGKDIAHLQDSAADDEFVGRPTYSRLTGPGYFLRAKFFDYVHAYAKKGGDDAANLFGSFGDDQFVGKENYSHLRGDGYFVRAKFFESVQANGRSGLNDTARLYGSAGDDHLIADLNSLVHCSFGGEGFVNQTRGFESVSVVATHGGFDRADFYDSPNDDTLHARAGKIEFSGSRFRVIATSFDTANVYARSGGNDEAHLSGTSFDDTLVVRPEYARMNTRQHETNVYGFDSVDANGGSGGHDKASFHGAGLEDNVRADQNSVHLTLGSISRSYHATAFDAVVVHANSGINPVRTSPDLAYDFTYLGPDPFVELNAADYYDPTSPTLGIQEAIDALPDEGGVVTIPAGTYALRHGLVLRSGLTLRGQADATVLTRGKKVVVKPLKVIHPGDTSVEVESTAGMQVGDEVLLSNGDKKVDFAFSVIDRIEPGRLVFAEPIVADTPFRPKDNAIIFNVFPIIHEGWSDDTMHNIVIDHLTLDGNSAEHSGWSKSSHLGLVHLTNAHDLLFQNCIVRDASSTGMYLDGAHDVRIVDTLVDQSKRFGIYLNETRDVVISNCTVRRSGNVHPQWKGDGIIVNLGEDNRVENSLIEQSVEHGLHLSFGTRNAVFANNIVRNNGRNGIFFCWNVLGAQVLDNMVYKNQWSGIGGLGAGGQFGDRFNLVDGNECRNNGRWGIRAIGGYSNTISNNTCLNNSQEQPGFYSGIMLKHTKRMVVTGNLTGIEGQASTQKYGIEEFGNEKGAFNSIVNNQCKANRLGGIALGGAFTRFHGNSGSIVWLD